MIGLEVPWTSVVLGREFRVFGVRGLGFRGLGFRGRAKRFVRVLGQGFRASGSWGSTP